MADARFGVLDTMDETLSTPREGIKEHGPAYGKLLIVADLNTYPRPCAAVQVN